MKKDTAIAEEELSPRIRAWEDRVIQQARDACPFTRMNRTHRSSIVDLTGLTTDHCAAEASRLESLAAPKVQTIAQWEYVPKVPKGGAVLVV